MNDINIRKKLNLILFADDIMILVIEEDNEKLSKNLQRSLNWVQDWCNANELYISEEKTKYMIFDANMIHNSKLVLHRNKCNRSNCEETCTEIKRVKNFRYLGIVIDEKWSFHEHIDQTCKKLRQVLPKLYFVRNYLNIKNKKVIYDSWVKAHLLYGLEIYGWAKNKEIKKIQKLQNKIVKILFSNRAFNSTSEIFKKTGILRIKELQKYLIIIKNFYRMKNKREEKIRNKTYETKNTNILQVMTKNKFGERKQDFYIPKIFSDLPDFIWELEKIGEIKKKVRSWILLERDKV